MSAKPRAVLTVPGPLLWRRRFPLFSAFLIGMIGLGVVVYDSAAQRGDFSSGAGTLPTVIFLTCILVGLLGSLRINALGVFADGVAPPFKPVGKLAEEPFVVRWRDVTRIAVESYREDSPAGYLVTLELSSGSEIRFTGKLVANRFKSESQARRFRELLSMIAGRLPAAPFPQGVEVPDRVE